MTDTELHELYAEIGAWNSGLTDEISRLSKALAKFAEALVSFGEWLANIGDEETERG